jgi:hypothetical protein
MIAIPIINPHYLMKLKFTSSSLVLLLSFAAFLSNAQSPSLTWARSYGNESFLATSSGKVKVDATGNVYVHGYFEDTLDIDPGPGVALLVSNGITDIFFQKLDAAGNLVYGKSIGSSDYDFFQAMTVDAAGNLYATGLAYDTIDCDPGPGVAIVPGSFHGFILKLDPAGNLVWAKPISGSYLSYGMDIATDASGNIVVTGIFNDTIDLDPGPAVNQAVSAGNVDAFMLKLDPSGNFVWAKTFGANGNDLGRNIVTDATGNIYVSGTIDDTVDIDPGPGVQMAMSISSDDAYVIKLDPAGNLVWAGIINGTLGDYILGMAVQGNQLLLCGIFEGPSDLDPGSPTMNFNANGGYDFFVSSLDLSGNLNWVKTAGGTGYDYATDITADAAGNVYLTGLFYGAVDFDPGTATYNLNSSATGNAYMLKLDVTGNFVWAEQITTTDHTIGRGIAVDAVENIYLSSDFRGIADYATGPGVFNLSANGEYDIAVAKYNQCATWSTINQVSCNAYSWMGNTYTSSGIYSDTLSNANTAGCDSIQFLQLVINSTDTTTSVTGATITSSDTVSSHQWVDCSNAFAPISGETAQVFIPASNGTYAVILDNNGCIDTSSCIQITSTGIGVNELSDFEIYPNPSAGNFFLKSTAGETFIIYNATGQLIRTIGLAAGTIKEVSDLEAGVYFIRSSESGGKNLKLTISR